MNPPTKPEIQHILCDCHDPEHQAILSYWPDDEPHEKMMYIQIHLVTYDNFFKRLWAGLRYAFGYHCRFGHWDEILLSVEESKEVWDFLCGFLQNKNTSVSQSPLGTGVNAPDTKVKGVEDPNADWQVQNAMARHPSDQRSLDRPQVVSK